MQHKSEWEKFLLGNIITGKGEHCLQKKGKHNLPVLEDLNKKEKGFASKLKEAFNGLAQQSVVSLEDEAVDEVEEITEVFEMLKDNTEVLIEGGDVSVTNVILVDSGEKKGYAARLEEALNNVAQQSNTSSVGDLEMDFEVTKILTESGRDSVTRVEMESTTILEEGDEHPLARVEKENV